jgi:hypothetical protein
MHATMCRALKLEFDDRPEPIEEIRVPEGVEVADLFADLAGDQRRVVARSRGPERLHRQWVVSR